MFFIYKEIFSIITDDIIRYPYVDIASIMNTLIYRPFTSIRRVNEA